MAKPLQITVKFFTTLREVTGKKEETVQIKGNQTTVQAVLNLLDAEHGPNFNEYVFDRRTGEIKGFLQFLVNGRSVSFSEHLRNGDILAIIPPVGGG